MTRLILSGMLILFLALALPAAEAATADQGPAVTYQITLAADGSASWNMEYRTPLVSGTDVLAFQNYSAQIDAVYLPSFTDLMTRSAAEAAAATAREVRAGDFTADAVVQSGPTGSYGVVHYRCRWTGFAKGGEALTVGDVFVGGLYLGKDHALVLRPPEGFAVAEAQPAPDQVRDGLIWYGIHAFGAGEPRLVLRKEAVPLFLLIPAGVVVAAIAFFLLWRRRAARAAPDLPPQQQSRPADPPGMPLEDRIVKLLRESGGSLYQSEIVDRLALPKSTVSEAVNSLHGKGRIEKVKKGRENLIRLV